jgi:hypothetical protein
MHKRKAYALCHQHLYRYVHIRTSEGRIYDGIIDSVDDDFVYLAVPRSGYRQAAPTKSKEQDNRQYADPYAYGSYPGYQPYMYGYPGYQPAYPPYNPAPYPRPHRRFRRVAVPLAFITGVALGRVFD